MLNASSAGNAVDDAAKKGQRQGTAQYSEMFEEGHMEFRTRGIVIALASSAAGGLLPAAVSEQMSGNYLMVAGLGAVVLLNAAIAFIHIKEPAHSGRSHDEDSKTDGQKSAPYALRAVKPSEPA